MPQQKLSQHLADSLPPVPDGKKSIEHNDPDIRGFHIRQNAGSSVGTWVHSYTNAAGKRSHCNLGRTDVMPFEEARALAIEKRLDVWAGRDSAYERLQAKKVLTLAEFYEQHFLPYIKPRLRTWKRYACYWNCRIRDRFGAYRLDRIPLPEVQAMQAEIVEAGGKPATADHYVKLLKRMMVVALKQGHIAANPLEHAELLNADNRQQRYLSRAEMQRLMTQLSVDKNREVAGMLTLLVATGARRGEAFHAKWADIDLDVRTWHIPAASAKSKVGRYVPLNALALAALDEAATRRNQHQSDYVFESPRTGSRFTDIKNQWQRILRDAGVEKARTHDLRHTAASWAIANGSSLYAVSKLLGHSDVSVTQRYAHLSQETLQTESDRLGTALLETLLPAKVLPDPGREGSDEDEAAENDLPVPQWGLISSPYSIFHNNVACAN